MFSTLPPRWVGLAFLLLVLALALGNLILLAGSVYLLLVALVAILLQPPQDITPSRRLPRNVCWAGDVIEVERKIEAASGVGPLFVHDPLPEEALLVEGNNFRVVWKLPGARTYDLSYRIRCPKRGVFNLEETSWECQAPLGLRGGSQGTAGPEQEIAVVPRFQGVRRFNQIRAVGKSRRPDEDVSVLGAATTDFRELRPYVPGDAMRSVNWKASARRAGYDNPLLVNEYEPEGKKAIWIFLDGADYMEVGTALTNLMEHAVEAVGSIAQYYLTRGFTLGAYVYNSPAGILTPELGQKQFQRLTQMLTTLKVSPANEDLLQAVEWCKGFLFRLQPVVFVISRLDIHYAGGSGGPGSSDAFTAGVRRLIALRGRNRRPGQVKVVNMDTQGYLRTETSLEALALGMLHWESRPLFGALRRDGAAVMDWNPLREDITSTLIRHLNAYR